MTDTHPLLSDPTSLHPLEQPLPPVYGHDGPWKYYAVWAWRLVIFSLTGSTSLRACLWCLSFFSLSLGWTIFWATVLELLGAYPLTALLLGTLLGQRRFFGRLVYRGWGRWLPSCLQHAWLQSKWV